MFKMKMFLIGLFRFTTGYTYIFPSVEFSVYVLAFYTMSSVRRKVSVVKVLNFVPSKDCIHDIVPYGDL